MKKLVATALLALTATAAAQDVLLIESIEAGAQSADMRPARGMSMERVEASFGAPVEQHAPIGEPPITRWDYAGFSVYFEHQYVIHAVAR